MALTTTTARTSAAMTSPSLFRLFVLSVALLLCAGFDSRLSTRRMARQPLSAKKKAKQGFGGGGFGKATADAAPKPPRPVPADKQSLEKQWDTFASITDLEITPKGSPDDEGYNHFIVSDVFVRVGPPTEGGEPSTGWYRVGKVVTGDYTDIRSSLSLQQGLIFWTAVHMYPQIAAKGNKAAKLLQLGICPPSMTMADESDGALDEDEAEDIMVSPKAPISSDVSLSLCGFRPDFNPAGFTYKRRESAALKKRTDRLAEMKDAS